MGTEKAAKPGQAPPYSFFKSLLKAAPVIIVVSLFTLYAGQAGWLSGFETSVLDNFLLLKERTNARHVVIVAINDSDYKALFEETSPLHPGTLGDLIQAVAGAKPRVIGVDIDTSRKAYQEIELSGDLPPIIWAKDAHIGEEETGFFQTLNPFRNAAAKAHPETILGGKESAANSLSGIALLPEDSDRNIRQYTRKFATISEAGTDTGLADSFHWAIVKEYCRNAPNTESCKALLDSENDAHSENLVLNHSIAIRVDDIISAWDIIGPPSGSEEQQTLDAAKLSERVKDKIVLIGGMYRYAGDLHYTPQGRKYGVEIVATAIESELQNQGIRPVNQWLLFVVNLCVGVLMVFFNVKLPRARSRFLGVFELPFIDGLIMVFIALPISFLVYHSLALWANFIPVIILMRLQNYYEQLSKRPAANEPDMLPLKTEKREIPKAEKTVVQSLEPKTQIQTISLPLPQKLPHPVVVAQQPLEAKLEKVDAKLEQSAKVPAATLPKKTRRKRNSKGKKRPG